MARPKQQFLAPEMEPKKIKEIEDAANELFAVRTERISLNQTEEGAQATLVAVMEKHKLSVYKLGKLIVTIEPGKVKAKVKEAASREEEGDDPPEED